MPSVNPYVVILTMLTVTGIAAAIWGWYIIARAKKTGQWPSTEGEIVKSQRGLPRNDLLPEIVFHYTVEGRAYTQTQVFPSDLTPDEEFSNNFLEKYPAGARVSVYYDPYDPEQATLDKGFISGNWMVFTLGVGMTLFGVVSLYFHA
jgi:Protein of unknown function (DUF3592)